MAFKISNLDDLRKIFQGIKTPIFYIANNVDHGVGLEKILPNYHIICIDHDDEVDYLEKKGIKVFCLEKAIGKKNVIFRNSALLLREPKVLNYIKKNSLGQMPAIILFKPSASAEKIAASNNWRILNNSATLSGGLEDKLNFPFIAKSLRIKIPDVEIVDLARMSFWELKKYYDHFVVQFKKGFAGNSTFFIQSNEDYGNLLNKCALDANKKDCSLPVKVSKYIKGIPITLNACVTSGGIIMGKPCYQITGEWVCTNNKGATCGNDWVGLSLPDSVNERIFNIAVTVGRYLKEKSYKGIFGLDLIMRESDQEIYLIEINPRLVASVPFYTKLEIKNNRIPLFALHVLEFLGVDYSLKNSGDGKEPLDVLGSQLVLRNKNKKNCIVKGDLRSGVYSFGGKELKHLRIGYSIDDLDNQNEFIILAPAKNRAVKPETEAARLEFLAPLVESDYRLKAEKALLAEEVYKKLKLEA